MLALFLAFGLGHAADAPGCDAPVRAVQLVQDLREAEAAHGALEVEAFREAIDRVEAHLPCLTEVVHTLAVARLHRVQGLWAHRNAEGGRVTRAFLAARTLAPDVRLSTDVVPEGHALRLVFESTVPTPPRTRRVPMPRDGNLHFDGSPGGARPVDRPTLLQIVRPDGTVGLSRYLDSDAQLPDYPRRTPLRTAFAVTAGALGAVGLGVLGGAFGARAQGGSQTVQEALIGTSIALGALGVGSGAAAGLVGPR